MKFTMWLYRLLAQALPHEFKIISGAEVVQLGEDAAKDVARQNGCLGLLRMVMDLAIRIPIEYLSEMRRDLGYALRTMFHSKSYAITAILSLGLGIGVASFAYSVIYGLMFREIPLVRQPQQLVTTEASYPYFEHFREQREIIATATAYIPAVPVNVAAAFAKTAKSERVRGQIVSPEYFQVLGIGAQRGRVFNPAVDKPGQAPVVIISARFWHQHLNSDPDAVGLAIRLNGHAATVVGVAPEEFVGSMPIVPCDLFIPTTTSSEIIPELGNGLLQNREARAFVALMRLAPGITRASAEAALDVVARQLDESGSNPNRSRKDHRLRLSEGGVVTPTTPEIRAVFYGLFGVLVSLLLGITCMNLANMLLSRAGARQREMAIRLAVGASRFRIIRQLLTECILLSMGGGVVGIVLAFLFTRGISKMKFPGLTELRYDVSPDWHALVFAFVLSLTTGIAFGLAPALAATRAGGRSPIHEGFLAQMRGYRRFGIRNLTMVLQVSGSVALLLITLALSFGGRTLWNTDSSVDIRTLYLMTLDPVRDGYSPDQAAAFFEKLPDQLMRVPAVEAAALTTSAPFDSDGGGRMVEAYSEISEPDRAKTILSQVSKQTIGRGYFAALDEDMLAGREFNEGDQRFDESRDLPVPIILNRSAAEKLFGNKNPIGRRIMQESQPYEVIGMVRDLRPPVQMARPQPALYLPLTRAVMAHAPGDGLTLMIRSSAGASAMEGIRRGIASMDSNLSIFNVRTLSQAVDAMNAMRRISIFFYSAMGLFGLVLASIGLAGVTAFAVAQRGKEIGIRMALGAQRSQVLRLVMREGAGLMLVGSALGLFGAMLMGRALSATFAGFARVFDASAKDPRLIIGVPLLLVALVMVACYLPARRAAHIDPLTALREE